MSRGHVFVVHGDLLGLALDDIVVPTDRHLATTSHWHAVVPATLTPADLDEPAWPEQRWAALPGADGVWLVDTGGTAGRDVDWYVDGVRRVLSAVAARRRDTVARHGRERPIVGLPLVGVGRGGAQGRRGEMIAGLLAALEEHADAGFDVALVLATARDHGAVQHVRRDHLRHDLDESETASARRVAAHAVRGELALFLGAGVSMSAGLPSWGGLLTLLAARAGLDADQIRDLATLDVQDQAAVLETSLDEPLVDALAAVLGRGPHGLSHALLAALPVREAVTTNYDSLFEDAWRAVHGVDPAVLPYDPPSASRPWLLKLHGDLARRDGVVLTRDHYLRFSGTRGALSGTVQGLLMTRHVLFTGFGLADENFLRLADGVRQVRRDERIIGTALSLIDQPLRRRLWEGQLDYQSFGPPGGDMAVAARRLEVFLDLVAHLATDDASFLLDPRYAALLSEDDAELARALTEVGNAVQRPSSAARQVRAVLERLGSASLTGPPGRGTGGAITGALKAGPLRSRWPRSWS